MKIAIVTVSNDAFLKGTLVLASSIYEQNEWFDGDFLVIDAGLSDSSIKTLDVFQYIKLIKPTTNIKLRVKELVRHIPSYVKSQARFFSLETFNLKEYDKILFLDSDMMCLGNLEDLFQLDNAFSACADPRFYLGYSRDQKTFLPISRKEGLSKGNSEVFKSFNTGLMLVKPNALDPSIYTQLCSYINPSHYRDIKSGHTDSVILNQFFFEQVTWLPLIYNFFTLLWNELPHLQSSSFKKEIRMLHFLGRSKPWEFASKSKNEEIFKSIWDAAYRKIKL